MGSRLPRLLGARRRIAGAALRRRHKEAAAGGRPGGAATPRRVLRTQEGGGTAAAHGRTQKAVNPMALTRDFRHTVVERVGRDPKFARALLDEAAAQGWPQGADGEGCLVRWAPDNAYRQAVLVRATKSTTQSSTCSSDNTRRTGPRSGAEGSPQQAARADGGTRASPLVSGGLMANRSQFGTDPITTPGAAAVFGAGTGARAPAGSGSHGRPSGSAVRCRCSRYVIRFWSPMANAVVPWSTS